MGWGIVGSRGKAPNTSETCCAFRRPHFSKSRAAHLQRPVAPETGGAHLYQRAAEPFGRRLGALRTDAPYLEAAGAGASFAGGDAQPRVFRLPPGYYPLSPRLICFSGHIETLSAAMDALSGGISPPTGNLGTLSNDIEALTGHVEALSEDINHLTCDIFGLTGDIFDLSEGIFPQLRLSKPLTHSQLSHKHHPGPAPATLNPQTHPPYA